MQGTTRRCAEGILCASGNLEAVVKISSDAAKNRTAQMHRPGPKPSNLAVISSGVAGNSATAPKRAPAPEETVVPTRQEATKKILEAKQREGLTFEQIATAVGRNKVWVTAALLGQAPMSPEEAEAAVQLLGLGPEVAATLQQIPMKGSLETTVPVDPLIYRFHEITQVYGTTIKALIHEMFGDGIMSAIDFEMDIQREQDPKGDRVVVTYSGKFLPYRKW
jgi:cyanate lyase